MLVRILPNPAQTNTVYDPSNGTVSEGWLIEKLKGAFSGRKCAFFVWCGSRL